MFKLNILNGINYFSNDDETVGLFHSLEECIKVFKSIEKTELKEIDKDYFYFQYPDLEEALLWIKENNFTNLNVNKILIQEKDNKIGLKIFIFDNGECLVGTPNYYVDRVL